MQQCPREGKKGWDPGYGGSTGLFQKTVEYKGVMWVRGTGWGDASLWSSV